MIEADPSIWDAYHGFALCAFKSGRPDLALEKLDRVIDMIVQHKRSLAAEGKGALDRSSISITHDETKKKPGREESCLDMQTRDDFSRLYFRYLRALCHKALRNFEESQRDYCSINRAFEISEGKSFSKQILAMVMMPLQANRKSQLRFIENFEEILQRYEEDRDRRVLAPHYIAFPDASKQTVSNSLHRDNKHTKWLDRKLTEVVQTLQGLYFFRRFKLPRLLEFMDRMELDIIPKKNILFFQPKKVYVIVSGSILMKNHGESAERPQTLAKFGEGMILNFYQDRMEAFNSIETWFVAQVESEVAIFDKDYFQRVWNEDIQTRDLLMKRAVLQAQPVFSDISELTLMSMVSELFQERVFIKGQVILPQSQYSPTNKFSKTYFATQDPGRFAERIKAKKAKAKKPMGGSKSKERPLKPQEQAARRESVASAGHFSDAGGGAAQDSSRKRTLQSEMSDTKHV